MPIRLLAIDLDGTLVNSRWQVSEANRQALAAVAGRGIQIVVVTGRRLFAALPYVEQIPHPVTLITSNGALVRTESGEVVYQNFLPREMALNVLEIASEYRPYSVAIFHLPGRGQVTMQDNAVLEGPLGWYMKTNSGHLRLVPDLAAAVDSDPIQVMIGGPPAQIEPAELLLRESLAGPSIHLTWTKYLTRNISILDVMNRGCCKGRALKFWAERCGISPDDVMAIGDNFNDLEMLEFAGRPVLMGNHCAGLDRPEWPITLPCDDDGLAAAVKTYILEKAG
jgi:Cof subfamily protein (haloacid dehalogenase superfamily)